MTDLNVRADSVDVEQIMGQIRARIQEKRGADYTEAEIRELAHVQLEKFIDPQGVRSDLVDEFRRRNAAALASKTGELNEEDAIGRGRPGFGWFRWIIRRVFARSIKMYVEVNLRAREELYFEVMHNLVVEVTRLGIEARNAKMRVESLSSRLDFDERRGRSLEEVVQYRPGALERPQERPQERNDRPDRPNRDSRDFRNNRDNRQQRPPQQRPPNPPNVSSPPVATSAPPLPSSQPAASNQPVPAALLDQPSAPLQPGMSGPPIASGQPGGDRFAGDAGEHRRRRRRRRRRPGQTMADTGGAAAASGAPSFAPTDAAPAPGRAPEDGGAGGQ